MLQLYSYSHYEKEANRRKREAATLALNRIRDPQSAAALFASESSDTDTVIWAVGELKAQLAVGPLLDGLEEYDRNVDLAAKTLREFKEPQDFILILSAINDLFVRAEEHSFLYGGSPYRLSSHKLKIALWAVEQLKIQRDVEALINALNHKCNNVRDVAAQALVELKDSQAIVALIEHPDCGPSGTLTWAFEELKTRRDTGLLLAKIEDPHPAVHYLAAKALAELRDSQTVRSLIAISAKSYQGDCYHGAAIDALRGLNDPAVADIMLDVLKTGSEGERAIAGWHLGITKDARKIDALSAAMHDENVIVRRNVVGVLAGFKNQMCLDPLINALKDNDEKIRATAAKGLAELKDGRAVDPLIAVLKDCAGGSSRIHAAKALGNLNDSNAIEELIAVLGETSDDDDWVLKSTSIKALVTIKDMRAIASLVACYDSCHGWVKIEAAKAIDAMLKTSSGLHQLSEHTLRNLSALKDTTECVYGSDFDNSYHELSFEKVRQLASRELMRRRK